MKILEKRGKEAQGKSTIVLKNETILPLKTGTKIYAEGMINPELLNKYGELVKNPKDADIIVTRIRTPYDERSEYFIERFFHQGRLYFTEEEQKKVLSLISKKPTVVIINLERPAILTEIDRSTKALLADFGTSDEVLTEVLFGKIIPEGKLPFELPSSNEAVKKQLEDLPYDSKDPLYPFGHGLSY